MQIFPLFDNILVKPQKIENKTLAGIIIPESSQEKPQIGEVLAVGPGLRNENLKLIPMEVKKGDKVMYKTWGANEIKDMDEKEEKLIMKQTDLLAIVVK